MLLCANLLSLTPFQENNYKSRGLGFAELNMVKEFKKLVVFHSSETLLNLPVYIEMF